MNHRVPGARPHWTILFLAAVSLALFSACACGQERASALSPTRRVAITFDDLPVVSVARYDIAANRLIVQRLIEKLTAQKAPAIGFVNEEFLRLHGEVDERRVALLQQWADAGVDLGNHTFSHLDFNDTPLVQFQDDVTRGEEVTYWILRRKGKALRYFRYPFLHTGSDSDRRRRFEEFLSRRGYSSVPVTIDASDWKFSYAYERAREVGDTTLERRIRDAYLLHTEQCFEYFERLSVRVMGYAINQILLLHANVLNAETLDEILQLARRRGYEFITVEEALNDPAYKSFDTYTGADGITWISRWAVARRLDADAFGSAPETPDFITQGAKTK
jgi:peptidoglycan/xylan/chitin deacetylase (PgdA/CDA1 family)